MTRYDRSPWVDRCPRSRVPAFPRQRGSIETGVVIVGGGLTGCATAYAFAAAGLNVALVESGQIGRGVTGASAGWIAEEPGVAFGDLERAVGLRAARRGWQAWRRAALDFTALLRRLDVTSLEPRGAITLALTPEQAARLARDRKARRNAGLDAPALTSSAVRGELALDAAAALRARDGATVDPYRACVALAGAAVDRGAALFERSSVRRITFTRRAVDVITAGGTIRAARVVIATGLPTPLFKALVRHFWFRTTFLALTERVPAAIRRQLGRSGSASASAVLRDLADPPHVVRWVDEERLLVMGADMPAPPPRRRARIVVQRTGQLMYELSTLYPDVSGLRPEYGWAADYARSWTGLPHIGPHRNFPHHLFAFGDAGHTVTGAYLASRILLRQHLGESDPMDVIFAFRR